MGILQFTIYLVLAQAISSRIFAEWPLLIRVWAGLLLGIVSMMWLVALFSLAMGFTVSSHLCAMLAIIGVFIAVRARYSSLPQSQKIRIDQPLLSFLIPTFLFTSYLFYTHILRPGDDGSLNVGQSTFGDLSLHLGIITSIAEQNTFPPEYSIFPGHLLSYPFLVDSLSSSIYLFGTSLQLSVLFPSLILMFAVLAGFYILAYEILKKKYVALLASILFFFNGGFGFGYFLDGLSSKPENFTRIFSEFYQTPTNLTESNIRWSNVICDMLIPQRTTLAGWAFLIFALWLLNIAVSRNSRKYFVLCGLIAGLMPMIHTHSFLALGMVSLTWMPVYLIGKRGVELKAHFLNWVYFGLIASILALPQLFYWTLRQASEGKFLRFHFNWVNNDDFWLWFWVKNVGLVFIFLVPALLASNRKKLSIYSGAITIFVISELILFQPNEYDNNKLFYVWYLFTCILVADYMINVYEKLNGLGGRNLLAGITLFTCTFSGLLTMTREAVSNYILFDKNVVDAATIIKSNTPKNALFVSSDNHNNVISSLTGRNILSGSPSFLFFHGVNFSERAADIASMYEEPDKFDQLAKKYKVDYVYLSSYERSKFKTDDHYLKASYPLFFQNEEVEIFAISDRARNSIIEIAQH